MEIIKEINRVYNGVVPECELSDYIKKYKAEVDELQQKLHSVESDRASAATETNEDNHKISVIFEFMDTIGVEKEYFPFEKEQVDVFKDFTLGMQIDEYKEQLKVAEDRLEMYTDYYNFMRENSSWTKNIPRHNHNRYISTEEFYIDICYLYLKARQIGGGIGFIYEKEYIKAINCFTVEAMKAVGHPDNDIALENGTAEMIAAICRVSWEYAFLDDLANMFLKASTAEKHNLKKEHKSSPIFDMWFEDTNYIDKVEDTESTFCRAYRKVLPPKKIADVNYFIKKFRKGLFL